MNPIQAILGFAGGAALSLSVGWTAALFLGLLTPFALVIAAVIALEIARTLWRRDAKGGALGLGGGGMNRLHR